jgi:signal transduction histidine kinase
MPGKRNPVDHEPDAQDLLEALDHIDEEHQEVRDTITLRFLHEVSAMLSASLDYDTTLHSITRIAVPHVADCCMVDMVQNDGSLRRVAVLHRDHDKEPLVWMLDQYNTTPPGIFGRTKVLRTGRSELYANVTDELLQAVAQDSEHLRIMRKLNFRSFMCAPLKARGRVLGTVSFTRDSDESPYEPTDLALVEDLAARAAMAIDNSMLYTREQEANRVKDEFLATVSHELRTPLTPIFGALYMMRSQADGNEKLASAIEVIERNARSQALIIEDLLDISRIASGRMELHRRNADVLQIVENAIELLKPAASSLGIQLKTELDRPSRPVYCDPERMQQVVWNLLSNAIKFTPEGGQIDVKLETRDSGVRIRVKDNGSGIHPQFLPHVFDRFRQADKFPTRSHGGLGLGLSIVQYIVERHGGEVHAESDGEGQGASFTVDLPFS